MPPRHRFLEPIHNVKEGFRPHRRRSANLVSSSLESLGGRYTASAAAAGGASRDRTDDLKLAKLALSQLSYGPSRLGSVRADEADSCEGQALVGREGVEPSTSRLSGVRSNHLSYRPPKNPVERRSAETPPSPATRAAGGVSQLRLTRHRLRRRDFQDEGT